jgi:hypothetical protein
MINIVLPLAGCIFLIVLSFLVLAKVVKPAIDSQIRLRFDSEFNRRFDDEWERRTNIVNIFPLVRIITGLMKNKIRDEKYADYWHTEVPKYKKLYYKKAKVYSFVMTVSLALVCLGLFVLTK